MSDLLPSITNTTPPMSQHDWEMLSLSVSASALGFTDPSAMADLPTSHTSEDPASFPGHGPSNSISTLLHDDSPAFGLSNPFDLTASGSGSDEFPQPLSNEWNPRLSVSTDNYPHAPEHVSHENNQEYTDELHVLQQNLNISTMDRESFLDPSEMLSVSENSIREFYLESECLMEQRTLKKDASRTRYRWWRRQSQTSVVVWSMAVVATIVGVAVIGRSWKLERYQNEQLRLELSAKDEKLDYLLYQVNRLKEVLGGQHKVGI